MKIMNEIPGRSQGQGNLVDAVGDFFATVQEAMRQGKIDALTKYLESLEPERIDTLRENLSQLSEADQGLVVVVLHHIEDQAILSDPGFQESLKQMEAGELTEITDFDLAEVQLRSEQ
jgi:hypothetical protein